VKIAYGALQKALADKPRAPIDGFTPEQRFFLSYGTIWRISSRPEAARLRVATDPHSPGEFRANGRCRTSMNLRRRSTFPKACRCVAPLRTA